MNDRVSRLQSKVLAARAIPGVKFFFHLYYKIAVRSFVWFTVRKSKKFKGMVQSIYLRRGGGRSELIPGASDLDFFLVLRTVSAEEEMDFLKKFWESYHRWRVPFPFLGEVLMGDENELLNWLESPNVRAYEASFSWLLLWGEDVLQKAILTVAPDLRDIFSECLKYYWALLQPILKLRTEHFQMQMKAHELSAVHLRHAAKAAIDLFRLHHSRKLSEPERKKFWKATREELLDLLPEHYAISSKELLPILRLENPLFHEREPFEIFSDLVFQACLALNEIASELSVRTDSTPEKLSWQVHYHGRESQKDPYSFSIRELFAERLLFRHADTLSRAVLSESTAHMYFVLSAVPSTAEISELLSDLRDASFSFDRFSVAMPVTEVCLAEMERTSLLDSPFHSYYSHKEILLSDDGELLTKTYIGSRPQIPDSMLQKTFAEMSFSLRLQPLEMDYLVEKMVGIVLSMRNAASAGVITTDIEDTLRVFTERFPVRGKKLQHDLAPYKPSQKAKAIWQEIYKSIEALNDEDPWLISRLEEQCRKLEKENDKIPESKTAVTDLWINVTPILRMEINAMKDRYFYRKPILKI